MYENCVVPTQPGTDIKVTPESDVPTMPKATQYHLLRRLALKKVSDVAPFDVFHAISIITEKYNKKTNNSNHAFMPMFLQR